MSTYPAQVIPDRHCPIKFQRHQVLESRRGVFDAGYVPKVDLTLFLDRSGNFVNSELQAEDQKKSFESREPDLDGINGIIG